MDGDEEAGPVVRTAGPSYHRNRDYSDYQDNIAHIDVSAFLRKFGIKRSSYGTKAWFVKDVCGVICAIITWGLIFYAEYVITVVMLLPSPNGTHALINGVIFQFLTFLAIASHLKAMLTDPGAVQRGNATKEYIMKLGLKDGQVVYKCPKCISIKPERAHHCSVCKRCIKKMDHHCPWVNNCVGENNQKYFVLFTLYICLISCHAMYMSIYHFITCIRHDWKTCTYFSPAATTVFMIFLLFEALLFGIFTAIMCGTQIGAICSDETGIEQLKNETGNWEKKSRWLSLEAVFGHPFSYRWFSPFHSANTSGCKPEVYLYTV